MAEEGEMPELYGKPVSELRVVDLKKELDKRGLAKSGSKKELVQRLKGVSEAVFDEISTHLFPLMDVNMAAIESRRDEAK